MAARKKRFTRSTGVMLEIPVLDYLRDMAEKADRDRSFCINQIVREHAERNGSPLGLDPEQFAGKTIGDVLLSESDSISTILADTYLPALKVAPASIALSKAGSLLHARHYRIVLTMVTESVVQ